MTDYKTANDDKMLARIAALLRQAEGTDNTHEADAFMTAAQRLATAASIDLAVARSHAANRSAAQAPTQRTITIGSAGTRGLRTYVQLFVVIATANDVRCDIASNSTFVYAYGFAEDIDASHALYASLVVQMVRASDSLPLLGRAPAHADDHRPPQLPAGVRARVGQRLGRGARGDPARGHQGPRSGAGYRYCLAGQGCRVARLLSQRVESTRHLAGQQCHGGYSSSARRAGDRAGRRARLGNSPELPGARTALGR